MSFIQDDQLHEHASRLKDKVVVITGAANGIGRETAMQVASHGAKVVIGDYDGEGAEKAVRDIENAGGKAVAIKCNVLNWDEQVAMFDLAISKFGAVDVVVPNAGISEAGQFYRLTFQDGKPVKPNMRTLDVNLTGVLYTVHLALHYLKVNRASESDSLKAIVLIGSMASWAPIPLGTMYTASKHAILGMMRSLHMLLQSQNIRIATIHPFFADTGIVPWPVKVFLAGIPLTPVARISGAIIHAATNPDPETSGCAFVLSEDKPVFMIPREEFKLGVYGMVDRRLNALLVVGRWLIAKDLIRLLGRPVGLVALASIAAKLTWGYREQTMTFIQSYTSA